MQTKLIATIGPRSRDRAVIEKLVAVGDLVRGMTFLVGLAALGLDVY